MWIYPILKAAGIRQIFFSGDTDGAVGLAGSRQWIKELNYPVTKSWQPWYTTYGNSTTNSTEVSGYVVQYDGLDFATVHGVGHMAPQWARKPMQEMFFNWI
jgi:carboxypeptidase C (cathepsin A)